MFKQAIGKNELKDGVQYVGDVPNLAFPYCILIDIVVDGKCVCETGYAKW